MGDGRGRGERADAPSCNGGDGAFYIVGVGDLGEAADEEADGSAGLGREMEAAGGGEGDAGGNFGDDAGEAGVPEAFFHDEEGGVAGGFGVDDPSGVESGGGEGWGEEVLLVEHP